MSAPVEAVAHGAPATTQQPRDRRYRTAKAITEVLAPTVVLAAGYIAVTAATAQTIAHGLLWGLVAVLLGSVLPFLFILIAVRRGRISDHHVRVRGQRHIPLLVGLGCLVAGLGLLVVLHAPRPLIALFGLVIATLLPTMAVTVWWQISAHAAVAALVATFLVALWGPWLLLTAAGVAAVGWSRVALNAHTTAQVLAGTALGSSFGALAWLVLG